MISRGQLLDRLPAAVSLRFRANRNVRRVLGLNAPADLIAGLVPVGRNAVDGGVNRGTYTYWMRTRADWVDSFEPQPPFARYIRDAHLRNVRVHEVALSDRAGFASLLIPDDDGQARIASKGIDSVSEAAEASLGVSRQIEVETRTLDSFNLVDVGFLKSDTEGHELALLRGAHATISRSRPIVFIESEMRHASDAPNKVITLMLESHGYSRAAFVRRWQLVDIDQFDGKRDQLGLLPDFMNPAYVANFVFWP